MHVSLPPFFIASPLFPSHSHKNVIFLALTFQKHKYKGELSEHLGQDSVFLRMREHGLISFSDYIFLLTVLSCMSVCYCIDNVEKSYVWEFRGLKCQFLGSPCSSEVYFFDCFFSQFILHVRWNFLWLCLN